MIKKNTETMTHQEQIISLFESQGFGTRIIEMSDIVKRWTNVFVTKNNEDRGCFFFVDGEMKSGSEIDRLRNK